MVSKGLGTYMCSRGLKVFCLPSSIMIHYLICLLTYYIFLIPLTCSYVSSGNNHWQIIWNIRTDNMVQQISYDGRIFCMHMKYYLIIWNFVWHSQHWCSSVTTPTSDWEMSTSYGVMQSDLAVWELLELFKIYYQNKT